MHYTYQKLPERVRVFFTSIAAIRKDIFTRFGGFDPAYRETSIEDMEFGLRVTESGCQIMLDHNLQVEHLKTYNFADLLRTGFLRAAGVAKIIIRDHLRKRKPGAYHTAPASFEIGIILAAGVLLLLGGGLVSGSIYLYLAALLCYIIIITINAGFLAGFLKGRRTRLNSFTFYLFSGLIIFIHYAIFYLINFHSADHSIQFTAVRYIIPDAVYTLVIFIIFDYLFSPDNV